MILSFTLGLGGGDASGCHAIGIVVWPVFQTES